MSELGKRVRLGRIFDYETKTTFILPMDHTVEANFRQLEDPRALIRSLVDSGVNAFLFRKGLAKFAAAEFIGRCGFIYRITASTGAHGKPTEQAYVSTIEEAVRLGADAVAATIFVGSDRELDELRNFGILADACDDWGMPLIAETMPIGSKNTAPYDGPYATEDVMLAARVGAESGADIIKTYYTGSAESFQRVVRNTTVPVVVAGGPASTLKEVLRMVKNSMDSGAVGMAMGRKIWASDNPSKLATAIARMIRERIPPEEALKSLNGKN